MALSAMRENAYKESRRGWGGLWYFDWVRAAGLMCEAKSQYESRQEVGTGEEPPRDARSRPDWRRHGGRLEEEEEEEE